MLLQTVRDSGERDLDLRWRYFSLSQVNSQDEGWTIWRAAEDDPGARGRLAFRAVEAARRQERFEALHAALLEGRHENGLDLDDLEVVEGLAADAGLDMTRFRADLADPSILEPLARDHLAAVSDLGVFGTPTFHIPGRGAAYVRVRPAPEGSGALELFDQLLRIIGEEPYLLELKRPRTPAGVARPRASSPAETTVRPGG